jgi:hypothetical protein
MYPIPDKLRRGYRGGSLRAFRQFVWLETGSVKVALSLPASPHHPHQGAPPGANATGNASCSAFSPVTFLKS